MSKKESKKSDTRKKIPSVNDTDGINITKSSRGNDSSINIARTTTSDSCPHFGMDESNNLF